MLVRKEDFSTARELAGREIELIVCPLDDLWIRDTGPMFVVTEHGKKAGVDFNFNGWGGKQDYGRDAGWLVKLPGKPLFNAFKPGWCWKAAASK